MAQRANDCTEKAPTSHLPADQTAVGMLDRDHLTAPAQLRLAATPGSNLSALPASQPTNQASAISSGTRTITWLAVACPVHSGARTSA